MLHILFAYMLQIYVACRCGKYVVGIVLHCMLHVYSAYMLHIHIAYVCDNNVAYIYDIHAAYMFSTCCI